MSEGIGQALLNIWKDATGIFHNIESSDPLRNEEEVVPFTGRGRIDALADNDKCNAIICHGL